MEFIIDNLVWFIAGGVVILMTIIGYFAEKTDFGKNLASKNNEDQESAELRKEKHTKKEKLTKKQKESKNDEEIVQNQPMEEQFSSDLPIPNINQNPVILEQQNIEPMVDEPIENTVVENIPTEISEESMVDEPIENTVVENIPTEISEESMVDEPIENTVIENIPTEISSEPTSQEVVPVDLQSAAIEDDNMEIQPALETEPIPQTYQDQVTEIPTMENMIPDELPVIPEYVENNDQMVQIDNDIEQPMAMPITLPDGLDAEDNINQASAIEEKPVVITDEKVVPFDELADNMDVSPITVEQGIPAVNMELPNLETIAQDNVQSEEEDIWKF